MSKLVIKSFKLVWYAGPCLVKISLNGEETAGVSVCHLTAAYFTQVSYILDDAMFCYMYFAALLQLKSIYLKGMTVQ